MEKRVLLAVVLSFLVLTAYRALLPAPPKPVASAPVATSPSAVAARAARWAAPSGAPAAPGAAAPAQPVASVPAAAPTVADSAERDIVVTTNLVRAVFSNRGGVLKNWTLLHYAAHGGKPADLIPAGLPPTMPRPFSLRLPYGPRNPRVNSALYPPAGPDS